MKQKNVEKYLRKNNGITLIALVITIVVMLILAGVTINLTLGENGIFTTAQKAAQNYTEAQNKEIAGIQNFTQTVDKTIQDVTENWDTLASKAKPGDYVEYDGGNGYTGLWQVLYNDNTYGLQIISADNVLGKNEDGTDVKLKLGGSTVEEVKDSYNNAVNLLNEECRKYVNALYATSGRCVGSNPLSPDDDLETMDKVTLKFEYNGSTESGWVVGNTVVGEELNDYKAMQVATSQNADGICSIGKWYWLAYRNVYSDPWEAMFYVGRVNTLGNINELQLLKINYVGDSYPNNDSHSLRPVITLAPNLQTNEGDGSINHAFKLVAK